MSKEKASTQGTSRYENWLAILDAYGVQFLVLDALRDKNLLQIIRSNPGWTLDFADGESVLFTRSQALDQTPIAA